MPELLHPETIKAWRCPDGEVKTMIDIRERVPLSSRGMFSRLIDHRRELITCGVLGCEGPANWMQEQLFAIDPYLRLRWDYTHKAPPENRTISPCFVVERVDTALRAWLPIFYHCTPEGQPLRLGIREFYEIIDRLREGDMRRFPDPDSYLEYKRDKARKVRMANDAKATDKYLTAVDSLSDKQIHAFIAVERAIKTGEGIRALGGDARFLNAVWERQKQFGYAPIPGSREAFNPHMQPGKR